MKWQTEGLITEQYAGAIRHTAFQSTVIGVTRVKEVQDHFLVPWLFSLDDLRGSGAARVRLADEAHEDSEALVARIIATADLLTAVEEEGETIGKRAQ